MSDSVFNFNQFVEDSQKTLLKPKEYFSSMKKDGGLGEPIIKALIYGSISGVIALVYGLLGLSIVGGVFGSLVGGSIGILALIMSIVGAIIGLFIGAIITLIISAICGGETDFEATIRITASLMVLSPISALATIFTSMQATLGAIIGLVISLYGLYLLYNAIVYSLNGKENTAKIVSIILAVIYSLIIISTAVLVKKAANFGNKYMNENKKFVEELKKKNIDAGAIKQLNKIKEEMEKSTPNSTPEN